jgi:hypothetical protein
VGTARSLPTLKATPALWAATRARQTAMSPAESMNATSVTSTTIDRGLESSASLTYAQNSPVPPRSTSPVRAIVTSPPT